MSMHEDESLLKQEAAGDARGARVLVCMPVYNDWESAWLLLDRIDRVAKGLDCTVAALLIDDGSSEPPPDRLPDSLQSIRSVEILQLRRNLGHQRAIAIGLAFVQDQRPCDYVVVMDADGEDVPEDIPALIEVCRENAGQKIVFAKRGKRSEGVVFRLGYAAFKITHRVLTGRRVEVGNFSVIPFQALEQLVAVSELWNHYAAAVVHSRLGIAMLPLRRGHRLAGRSRMNWISLITHGMSAVSVYSERVGVRLMCLAGALMAITLCGLAATLGVRLFTAAAIPGWATTAAGILVIVLLNLFTLMIVFVLFVLQSRSMTGFLPVRDWHHFILRCRRLDG